MQQAGRRIVCQACNALTCLHQLRQLLSACFRQAFFIRYLLVFGGPVFLEACLVLHNTGFYSLTDPAAKSSVYITLP